MIVSSWNDVGVLVGKLIASEPPFVQISIALGAAFVLLMVIEGLRASFRPRSDEPRKQKTPPSSPPSGPRRSAAPPSRNPKLRANAMNPHAAPRPTIQRRPSRPHEQADSFASPELPQVASFEE